jgi:hypothetical protein
LRGRGFPWIRAEALHTQSQVIFLVNFADELQRKVPTGEIAEAR